MATCLEYSTQQITACTTWGQTQRTSCTSWGSVTRTSCASWGIFSFICVFFTTIIEWICLAVEVISEAVCLAWATTALVTCVLWEVVMTIAGAVFDVIEAVLGWLFSGVAAILDLIFSIPYVGRFLKWLHNGLITLLVTVPVTIGEGILYFVGLRPQKKLRVCTIIALDEAGNPVAPINLVVDHLNDTITMFRNRLNIQILNSAAGQFSTGLTSTGPIADASWIHFAEGPWPAAELDGACSGATGAGFGGDLGPVGSARQAKLIVPCFFGEWRRVTGFGAPVVVIVQRSIGGGLFAGCALGPLTDYVTLAATFTPTPPAADANNDDVSDVIALLPGAPTFTPPPSPNNLLAHELGHKCNLWHIFGNPANLMSPASSTSDGLDDWQIMLVRGSRHVSFL